MPRVISPVLQDQNRHISKRNSHRKTSYLSTSNIRRVAFQPAFNKGAPFSISSATGGFSIAHQTAVMSCNSIASFPNPSIISLVRSRNELVKWVTGDLEELTDGEAGDSNEGSTCFL